MVLGVLLATAASLLSSSKDIVSKRVSGRVDSSVSTFASFLYPLPLYCVILFVLWLLGVDVFAASHQFWIYVGARAAADAGAEWCKMKALAIGELSLVTSFFALYPLLLLLSSPIITGDALEPKAPLATGIIVLGTLIILYRPRGDAPMNWKAVGLSLLAAFFFSLNTALDRATVQEANPVFSAFVMTALSGIFVSPTLRREHLPQLLLEKRLFSLRGVFEVLFMIVKLSALTILSAPMVVAIGRLSTVLNVLAGHFMFGEPHLGRRLIGASLVCGGVGYLLF